MEALIERKLRSKEAVRSRGLYTVLTKNDTFAINDTNLRNTRQRKRD